MKIAIIGAGNVATALATRLNKKGEPPAWIFNRSEERARILAERIGSYWTTDPAEIPLKTDLYIFAVNDDAIFDLAMQFKGRSGLAVHTSGAKPGTVFGKAFARFGVFYPLQTFSSGQTISWGKIPICYDASAPLDRHILFKLAAKMETKPVLMNDSQRSKLHLAAVFANNFSNHCYTVASRLMQQNKLPFDMLHPLMEATVQKAVQMGPEKAQTGPAIRNDEETIKKHLDYLKQHPEWLGIYRRVTESIMMDIEPIEAEDENIE